MISGFADVEGPPGAPVVVLLGSLGSTAEMWQPQVGALTGRARVVALDRRGHAGTAAPPGPYSIEELGSDVIETLDQLRIERAHLVGLSLGGMEAMWVAGTAPERVARLVVLSTYAYRDAGTTWRERAALVRTDGTGSVSDAGAGRWLTPGFAAAHPEVFARFRAMIAGCDAEGYASCCEAIDTMDLRPLLPRITAPTLAVAAVEDPITSPEFLAEIAETVPDGRLITIDGAHVPTVESAAAVTAAILGHLEL